MPTVPPVVPVYAGPSITLPCTAAVQYPGESGVRPIVNVGNLVGVKDGTYATIAMGANGVDQSDRIKLSVTVPPSLLSAWILGFAYELRGASQTLGLGFGAMAFTPMDAAGVYRGGVQGVHEYPISPPMDAGMAEYSVTEMQTLGADRITTFVSVVAGIHALGPNNIAKMADLGGFIITPITYQAGAGNIVSIDTADITVFYSPAPTGTVVPLTVASVSAVSAATAGIDLDGLWGPETTWNNISRAAVINTPSVTSSADATQSDTTLGGSVTDQASQTQFVKVSIAAGALTGMTSRSPVHLQVVWLGRYGGGNSSLGGYIDFAIIGELALTKSDGTILLKGVKDGKLLYDAGHWKAYPEIQTFRGERYYPLLMDISSLTQLQLTDMNTNGFSILLRWNIATPINDGGNPGAVFLNGVLPMISFADTHPGSAKHKALPLNSL